MFKKKLNILTHEDQFNEHKVSVKIKRYNINQNISVILSIFKGIMMLTKKE